MKKSTIVRRSLCQYWRPHLAVLLATALATTVLIGALLVGGSVRRSLARLVFLRLGGVRTAVIAADLLPEASLAQRIERRTGEPAAAILLVPATATVPGSDRRANKVQICGVDGAFPRLAPFGEAPAPAPGRAAVSAELARHLAIAPGDEIVLRVEKLSGMPKDTPLARVEDAAVPLRLAVELVADDSHWARFGLDANHVAPHNVFVDREQLATALDVAGRANVFLAAGEPAEIGHELSELLTGADAGLQLHELPDGGWEVRSPRVFLPTLLADEFARQVRPPVGILTYLANRIEAGARSAPYSFVTGTDASWLPPDLGADGIVLNDWLAADLQAKVGDRIRLRHYVLGPLRELAEAEAEFTVRQIVPLAGPFADPALMPDFPGIADAKDCTDWDTGAKLDFDRIRPRDEAYWDEHRGTPKAFVSLARAQELWGNRFGNLTALRFRPGRRQDVERALDSATNLLSLGAATRPIWEDGMAASSQSTDFGGLFLGLSFFLIAAALLLTGLLYSLGLDRRREQLVTLRAVGWRARHVRRLFLGEALCVALPGIVLGMFGGMLYNGLVIRALTTVWRGSVGSAPLAAHVTWPPLLIGGLAGLGAACLALCIPPRTRHPRRAPRGHGSGSTSDPLAARHLDRRRPARGRSRPRRPHSARTGEGGGDHLLRGPAPFCSWGSWRSPLAAAVIPPATASTARSWPRAAPAATRPAPWPSKPSWPAPSSSPWPSAQTAMAREPMPTSVAPAPAASPSSARPPCPSSTISTARTARISSASTRTGSTSSPSSSSASRPETRPVA